MSRAVQVAVSLVVPSPLTMMPALAKTAVCCLLVEPHEHLSQVPAPASGPHSAHQLLAYLGREHQPIRLPSESHRLMPHLDAALAQEVFLDASERQRERT